MQLTVSIGQYSDTGARPRNEDFHGAATPVSGQLAAKGVMLAVADGVGGHGGGREAAESAVRSAASLTSTEALKQHVIDLIADNVPQLLQKVDERQVKLASGMGTLHTAGATPPTPIFYNTHASPQRMH